MRIGCATCNKLQQLQLKKLFCMIIFCRKVDGIQYQTKYRIIAYSLYYAEAAADNEFAGPISAALCPGNTALFEEMSQRGKPLATLCSIRPAVDIKTSDFPFQRRTRYRSTNWPVFFFAIL